MLLKNKDNFRHSGPSFLAATSDTNATLEILHAPQPRVLGWAKRMNLDNFPEGLLEGTLRKAVAEHEVIADLPSSAVLSLTLELVIKIADPSTLRYLETFDYVVQNIPSLPVARNLGVLTSRTKAYILMDKASGAPLDKLWPTLDKSQKEAIQKQLEELFRCLRALPRPSGSLSLGTGSPPVCLDLRRYTRTSSNIISSEREFNRFLVTKPGSAASPLLQMAYTFLREDHEIVMTHSDLHPRNIMVSQDSKEGTIKIEALLDWELSGWYPAYWEYVKALSTISHAQGTLDWYLYLPTEAIGAWGNEYAVDQLIDRRL